MGKVRTHPQWAGACRTAAGNCRPGRGQRPMRLDRPAKPCWTQSRKCLRIIEDEERKHPGPGSFRIHRMPAWHPRSWQTTSSADRALDFVLWEHDTLLPKYGINLGVEYTHTFGVGEIYDHEWFFGSSPRTVRNRVMANALGVALGQKSSTFPGDPSISGTRVTSSSPSTRSVGEIPVVRTPHSCSRPSASIPSLKRVRARRGRGTQGLGDPS